MAQKFCFQLLWITAGLCPLAWTKEKKTHTKATPPPVYQPADLELPPFPPTRSSVWGEEESILLLPFQSLEKKKLNYVRNFITDVMNIDATDYTRVNDQIHELIDKALPVWKKNNFLQTTDSLREMQVYLSALREEQIKILTRRYGAKSALTQYFKSDPQGEHPKEFWNKLGADADSEVSARLIATATVLKNVLGEYEAFLNKQSAQKTLPKMNINPTVKPQSASSDPKRPQLPTPNESDFSTDLFPQPYQPADPRMVLPNPQ